MLRKGSGDTIIVIPTSLAKAQPNLLPDKSIIDYQQE